MWKSKTAYTGTAKVTFETCTTGIGYDGDFVFSCYVDDFHDILGAMWLDEDLGRRSASVG